MKEKLLFPLFLFTFSAAALTATAAETPAAEMESSSETSETNTLTFEDLSGYTFEFSSGAGAWSTYFTIEKDGSFAGNYHDSDMGSTGDGYDHGTLYYSEFSGHFTDLTKVDDTTYEMTLSDIAYQNTVGETEIIDSIKYVYSEAYGLTGTDTFKICLPGTPVSALSAEVYSWVSIANDNDTELTLPIIVNEAEELGIYSYKRSTPSEEARSLYDDCKTAYDDLNTKLTAVSTQQEMNTCAGEMYTTTDACLNQLWQLLKDNVPEGKYQEILKEQLQWINEKEAAADKIRQENDGSSSEMQASLDLSARTLARCEDLLTYIQTTTE